LMSIAVRPSIGFPVRIALTMKAIGSDSAGGSGAESSFSPSARP
jgi:hypothetical protein